MGDEELRERKRGRVGGNKSEWGCGYGLGVRRIERDERHLCSRLTGRNPTMTKERA